MPGDPEAGPLTACGLAANTRLLHLLPIPGQKPEDCILDSPNSWLCAGRHWKETGKWEAGRGGLHHDAGGVATKQQGGRGQHHTLVRTSSPRGGGPS